MRTLYGDTESYSATPIQHGTFKYCEDVELTLFIWQIDDGPVHVEDFTDPAYSGLPLELVQAFLDDSCMFAFHQVQHDREAIGNDTSGRLVHPVFGDLRRRKPAHLWRCSMVQAMAHSLPGGLDKVGTILGLPEDQQKLKDSKKLIQLFCKPRPKKQKLRRATRSTHPKEWGRFLEYARQDVVAMRAVIDRLPVWNYEPHDVTAFPLAQCNPGQREFRLWLLDQRANARGAYSDVDLAQAIVTASDREKLRLAVDSKRITNGSQWAVDSTTQREKFLLYILKQHGIELEDCKADTLEKALETNLPQQVIDLINVRLRASKTSATKAKRVLNGVSKDRYMRGLLQYCGALRTMRWGGRLFQPQNLPRIIREDAQEWYRKKDVSDDELVDYVKLQIRCLLAGTAHMVLPNVMAACSNALRGCLIAPPGKKMVVSDLANIEGRGLAVLAGEEWKVKAFSDYDKGIGDDIYKLAYSRSFSCDPKTVKGWQRQIGKVKELGFGYEGGVAACLTMAETYSMDIADMTAKSYDNLPEWAREQSRNYLEYLYKGPRERAAKLMKGGADPLAVMVQLEDALQECRLWLSEKEFICCDSLKRMWRAAHPRTVQFWKDLKAAFTACIVLGESGSDAYYYLQNHMRKFPGHAIQMVTREDGTYAIKVGKYLEFDRPGEWRVDAVTFERSYVYGSWVRIRLPSGTYLCYPGVALRGGVCTYQGINQLGKGSRKWQTLTTYGGKIAENATQKFARDVLAHNMFDIEDAGYEFALTVHDEDITYAPDVPWYSVDDLSRRIATPPPWCVEIPLAAAGFETDRYRKDK